MNSIGRWAVSVAFAGIAVAAIAADGNEGPPGGKNREQMREQCKANPQECRERMQKHMQEWFKKVDKDGDGSISREEAKSNAPRVAEHFDEIDADRDGKVTMAELHAHHQKMREQHRAEHGDGGGEKKQ
jgi:Ca2+-binding EF-hand superfamily protein